MEAFLKNSNNAYAYPPEKLDPNSISKYWRRFSVIGLESFNDEAAEDIWKMWEMVCRQMSHPSTATDSLLFHKLWADLGDTVWSFCLAAGCPIASRADPFKSLDMLREIVSRQLVYTTDLHAKISELNKQIILQQRMITALAYRNVLENLSAETEGLNLTDKWHNFLTKMFAAVKDNNIPAENPFNDLFDQEKEDKKYSLEYLEQMARELFSTLSRTIHNFQASKDFDQYTLMPGQFDPMQIDFMKAMAPKKENSKADGSPDWEKERNQYPGHVFDDAARERVWQRLQERGEDVSYSGQKNNAMGKTGKKSLKNEKTVSISGGGGGSWNDSDDILAQIDEQAKETEENSFPLDRQTVTFGESSDSGNEISKAKG